MDGALIGGSAEARPFAAHLVDRDLFHPRVIASLERRAQATETPLAELVLALDLAEPDEVQRARADAAGLAFASEALLADPTPGIGGILGLDHATCLEARLAPYQRDRDQIIWVTDRPEQAGAVLPRWDRGDALLEVVTPRAFERLLNRLFSGELAAGATATLPEDVCARGMAVERVVFALSVVAVMGAALAGGALTQTLLLIAIAVNAVTLAVRGAALVSGWRYPPPVPSAPDVSLPGPRPIVSILVPLYREGRCVPGLIAGLARLRWPAERLDVKLVVEEVDDATQAAIARLRLPPWASVVVVPDGKPRTKPRALNYALGFCRGSIVGIFDAEDRPHPNQIATIAGILARADRRTVAVQCRLAWYNARDSWMTRCFQVEYAMWFSVLLRGFERLGLPVPLGGTSVYFRRAALERLGGWDAWNVTEDAELGMRIARAGLATTVCGLATEEEASGRPVAWLRQRSRWIKGFLITGLTQFREPRRLVSEVGVFGALAMATLFFGGLIAYLGMPLFWVSLISWLVTGDALWADGLAPWVAWPLGASLLAGQIVLWLTAILAVRRLGEWPLLAVLPLLPVYWTLGSIAAIKAVSELVVAPYYWDKTEHGISPYVAET